MKKILIGILIILMLLIPITSSLSCNTQKMKNSSKINNDLIQNEDVLTKKHVVPLLKEYFFIKDNQIKNIIKNIIIEIINTGDASIDEIKDILDSCGKTVREIYLFAEIKTTRLTDGRLNCYPGNFFTHFIGYNARGSYIRYRTYNLALYGWNLQINGENVEKHAGHFFGYYGSVEQVYEWAPPGDYYYFFLDGYAILTFHGA